ncbi:hypothetical protein [Nocardioides sp.]|uniref:hypothetical protein n=1 Tax=Nocardioides sp. TaxID=35761 RepID=UPI002B27266E|nr:hypothetical protein [Nocardioides sp.]
MTSSSLRPAPGAGASIWIGLLLFLGVFTAYTATVDLDRSSNDTYSAGLAGWVIATTGEPWLDDLAPEEYDASKTWTQVNERNGLTVVSRAPGPIMATVPAESVRHALTGSERFSLAPQAVTAAAMTAAAVVLFFLALRRSTGIKVSLVATAAFAFTTPVWSVSANAMWTHPITLAGILGMACFAARERWWLVGAFGGIAVLGRLHTAIIVAVLGCGLAIARRRPAIALQVGLASLVGVVVAGLWTFWVYGRWSPTGGYRSETAQRITTGFSGNGDSAVVNQLGMWVSPGYGILIWTPVLLLLLPAIRRGWHQVPTWARILPLGGVLYTLAQAQLNTFTGGDGFFGYRHGLEFLATVAPCVALAAAGHLGRVSRHLLGPLLGLQFAAFLLGSTTEAWYILFTDAWRDNSLALALRTEPAYGVLVAVSVLVGILAGRVLRDDSRGVVARPDPPVGGNA